MSNRLEARKLTLPTVPSLYAGEALYSWIGRLIRRNALGPWAQSINACLGGVGGTLVVDLPTGLGVLHEAVGSSVGMAAPSEWLDRTTLYPFHRPFISLHRDAAIRTWMLDGGAGSAVKTTLGRVANGFGASTMLRYCRACAERDSRVVGEPYWHLSWFIPEVTHCSVHNELLVVQREGHRPSNPYEPVRVDNSKRARKGSGVGSEASLRYSRLADSLLQRQPASIDQAHLALTYWSRARELGYVTAGGSFRLKRLSRDIRSYHDNFSGFASAARLLRKQSDTLPWLESIIHRPHRAVHPTCHLLLIDFLFQSIESWRDALNRKPIIAGDKLEMDEVLHEQAPSPAVLDTSISCREASRRSGLDVSTIVSARLEQGLPVGLRPHRQTVLKHAEIIKSLGNGKALQATAAEHGVSLATVCRILRRTAGLQKARTDYQTNQRRLTARRAWEDALVSAASFSSCRALAPAAYAWLRRHDRTWLDEHQPRVSSAPPTALPGRVCWPARDVEISRAIRQLVSAHFADGKKRVSLYGVLRMLRIEAMMTRNWWRLPQSYDALIDCTQSVRDFQAQRLAAAAERLIASDQTVGISRLMREARIRSTDHAFAARWHDAWQKRQACYYGRPT